MKKLSMKLMAATLITTMLIPMGAASASSTANKSNKGNAVKIIQQIKNTNENGNKTQDWKTEKENAKAQLKASKDAAKAELKLKKTEEKAVAKKTREEIKTALKAKKVLLAQNNDKIHNLKKEIISQKKEAIEILNSIKENNITISDDLLKQIKDSIDVIKADVVALNSSKGTINSIYTDIEAQLEKKDSEAVQTGIDRVLAIQEQRYNGLQKLHNDLQTLLNLLNQAKAANTQTSSSGTTTTTTTTDTVPATNGQTTEPAASNETNTQTGTTTGTSAQPSTSTTVNTTTTQSQTTGTQNQ